MPEFRYTRIFDAGGISGMLRGVNGNASRMASDEIKSSDSDDFSLKSINFAA